MRAPEDPTPNLATRLGSFSGWHRREEQGNPKQCPAFVPSWYPAAAHTLPTTAAIPPGTAAIPTNPAGQPAAHPPLWSLCGLSFLSSERLTCAPGPSFAINCISTLVPAPVPAFLVGPNNTSKQPWTSSSVFSQLPSNPFPPPPTSTPTPLFFSLLFLEPSASHPRSSTIHKTTYTHKLAVLCRTSSHTHTEQTRSLPCTTSTF